MGGIRTGAAFGVGTALTTVLAVTVAVPIVAAATVVVVVLLLLFSPLMSICRRETEPPRKEAVSLVRTRAPLRTRTF